jgi:hypothetical protein
MASQPSFVSTPQLGLVQIATADASNWKDVYTAAEDTKVVSLVGASDDGSLAHVVQVAVDRSGTKYFLGATNVPINAGAASGVPAVDLMAEEVIPGLPVDNDGQRYIYLQNGDKLSVKSLSTMTSAKLLSVSMVGGTF